MTTEPAEVYITFRAQVEATAEQIVDALAAGKPNRSGMRRNVAAIVDVHIRREFDEAARRLREAFPGASELPELASGFALRRFAYTGSATMGDGGEPK